MMMLTITCFVKDYHFQIILQNIELALQLHQVILLKFLFKSVDFRI